MPPHARWPPHLDAARRRDLACDLVADREVTERPRHPRLHLGTAAMRGGGGDEVGNAALGGDARGDIVVQREVTQGAGHLCGCTELG